MAHSSYKYWMIDITAQIGDELKLLRESSGLDINTACKKASFCYERYQQLENGATDIEIKELETIINKIYGLGIDDFFVQICDKRLPKGLSINYDNHDHEIIDLAQSKVWFENGIIMAKVNKNARQTLDDAKEALEAYKKIYPGYACPMCVDISDAESISIEARVFYSSDEFNEVHNSIALIVNSFTAKTLANLYLKVNKPFRPTKMFNNNNEALKWLRRFIIDPALLKTKYEENFLS